MFTDKICPYCHDTGTTTKGAADGYLDCTHCEAAELRAGLERYLRTQRPGGQIHAVNPTREWAAYKLAYAKALEAERAAARPAVVLSDEQVVELWRKSGNSGVVPFSFARAILAADQMRDYSRACMALRQPAAAESGGLLKNLKWAVRFIDTYASKAAMPAAPELNKCRAAIAEAETQCAAPDERAAEIIHDWPYCNPGCEYEDPHGFMHDNRSTSCSCEAAKQSILRQRASLAPAAPAEQQTADTLGAQVIQVEKMLCAALGRQWSAAGISVESLINELAARAAPVAQPEAKAAPVAAPDAQPDLHAAIMNLPCKTPDYSEINYGHYYRIGHRDARHAAAELVSGNKELREFCCMNHPDDHHDLTVNETHWSCLDCGDSWPLYPSKPASAQPEQQPVASSFSNELAAKYSPREIPEVAPEPFILGNQYRTQGGRLVRFVGIANEGNSYETMYDELGHHRYTRRDFGRGTGAAWDDDCVPPLYAAPVPAAAPEPLQGWKLVPEIPTKEMLWVLAGGTVFSKDWDAGKELQRKLPWGEIPAKTELEMAAGFYLRLLAAAPVGGVK